MKNASITFTPGPTPKTVRTSDGKVLTAPEDWVLLPPGDAALTRRVKEGGDHWVVAEKKARSPTRSWRTLRIASQTIAICSLPSRVSATADPEPVSMGSVPTISTIATACSLTSAPLLTLQLLSRKGGDIEEWPKELRVRKFPKVRTVRGVNKPKRGPKPVEHATE